MYESYWKLDQKPFENNIDPHFYYPSESHQAALLKLRYAVENRRSAALLTGASGTGKTLLCAMLSDMVGQQFTPTVRLVFPQMACDELLAYLANELTGAELNTPTPSTQQSIRQIEHFLTENTRQGNHAVVIVDEAHLIQSVDTLEALRPLTNFEFEGTPVMTLILFEIVSWMLHDMMISSSCTGTMFTSSSSVMYLLSR